MWEFFIFFNLVYVLIVTPSVNLANCAVSDPKTYIFFSFLLPVTFCLTPSLQVYLRIAQRDETQAKLGQSIHQSCSGKVPCIYKCNYRPWHPQSIKWQAAQSRMTVCRIKIKHVSLKVCTNKGVSCSGNKNLTPINAISARTLLLYYCNVAGDVQMDL